jgi:hypothetical protein
MTDTTLQVSLWQIALVGLAGGLPTAIATAAGMCWKTYRWGEKLGAQVEALGGCIKRFDAANTRDHDAIRDRITDCQVENRARMDDCQEKHDNGG